MQKTLFSAALALALCAPCFAQDSKGDTAEPTQSYHHHHHHCHHGSQSWLNSQDGNAESTTLATGSSTDQNDADTDKKRRRRRRHPRHDGFAMGGPQSSQRETAAMNFLATYAPEKVKEFETLKTQNPEMYRYALDGLSHRTFFLLMLKDRDPERFKSEVDKLRGVADQKSSTTSFGYAMNSVADQMNEPETKTALLVGLGLSSLVGLGAVMFSRRRSNV